MDFEELPSSASIIKLLLLRHIIILFNNCVKPEGEIHGNQSLI